MTFVDPAPDFNPLLMQHEANVALRGFEHTGEAAQRLEAEAQAQAHAAIPGGGVTVTFTPDPDSPDESLDPAARLRALRPRPRTAEPQEAA
jgi:hypothetical protein